MIPRTLTDRLSLRSLLTLPPLLLVLGLGLPAGMLCWQAARDGVEQLSGRLAAEAAGRIAVSLERQLGGAEAVLETAAPTGLPAPDNLEREREVLRERFWLATSVHLAQNNYVYYGDRRGRFIGLWRFSEHEAELRLRTADTGPRTLYRFSGINGALRSPLTEEQVFDPRERPWFQRTLASPAALGWTPVYVDFKTQDLVITRTRRVLNDAGEPEGVAATDVSLKQLGALLARQTLGEDAVAMVVEADGGLVGVSRGAYLSGPQDRLNAARSGDALVAGSFDAVRREAGARTAGSFSFEDADGRVVQVSHVRLDPALGLDWRVIVAAPRSSFLSGVQQGFLQAAVLAGIAALAALALGWAALNLINRELRRLTDAARRVGDGVLDVPPDTGRTDALGDLARGLADMQTRLLTDQLTGLSNRGAILHRIEDRILQQRRRGDRWPFAIMRVDLRHLGDVNARLGHGVGDAVLKEAGQRLRAGVRIGDIVARYGGDEFLLLLESVDNRADAEAARAHLEAAMQLPLPSLAGVADAPTPGAGFGVALYPDDGQDAQTLLRHAHADLHARPH